MKSFEETVFPSINGNPAYSVFTKRYRPQTLKMTSRGDCYIMYQRRRYRTADFASVHLPGTDRYVPTFSLTAFSWLWLDLGPAFDQVTVNYSYTGIPSADLEKIKKGDFT